MKALFIEEKMDNLQLSNSQKERKWHKAAQKRAKKDISRAAAPASGGARRL